MNVPSKLKFTKDHEWIKVIGDEAIVGITDYAQSELGEIVYVELPKIGETFAKDAVFGSVEAVKAVSDLFIPLSGEILEINLALEDKPELVNESPYEEGWMVRIALKNKSEVDQLLSSEAYSLQIQ